VQKKRGKKEGEAILESAGEREKTQGRPHSINSSSELGEERKKRQLSLPAREEEKGRGQR